jgi:tRNA dimethylallyltransferase
MKKLLVICGPTATGKTALAVKLAKKINGEIVSADSRQVYRGMDIGTGKNLPIGSKIKYPWFYKWGYYEIDGVKVWGYDLVDPKNDFSVAQYIKFADGIITDIQKRGRLPIITGGTGLYIKAIIDRIPTAIILRNEGLRKNLSEKSATELYEMLSQIDSLKAGSLNSSDKKNPRRLIRAIEVATWMIDNRQKVEKPGKREHFDILFIGLTDSKEILEKRVDESISTRVEAGIKEEVRKLIKSGLKWDNQSMMSLGYRQYRDFFEGGVHEEAVIDEWRREEKRYVKRQLTWFNKDKRINWVDISDNNFLTKVEIMVKKWHNQDNYVSQG